MTREKGILEDWHDQRGFGFIRRPGGGKLYVHMKSIGKSTERPKAGDILSYEVGTGANGRPAAVSATISRPLHSKTAGIAPSKNGPERVAAQPARREAKPGLVRISMRTAVPLIHDSYRRNRLTGSFILIDPGTNETVAAGMIV